MDRESGEDALKSLFGRAERKELSPRTPTLGFQQRVLQAVEFQGPLILSFGGKYKSRHNAGPFLRLLSGLKLLTKFYDN